MTTQRALQVLRAQLELRELLIADRQIKHKFVFFTAVGEPMETTYLPYNRWTTRPPLIQQLANHVGAQSPSGST